MRPSTVSFMLKIQTLAIFITGVCSDQVWDDWWTYELGGISGPNYWHINQEWRLCKKGKHQSPINIQAKSLLFDPNLKELAIDNVQVKGTIQNTGHDVTIAVNGRSDMFNTVNITSGPLSYRYTVSLIKIHFGTTNNVGSEHTINNRHFPAELQIYAYNSELYKNLSEASREAQGLIAISVFLQIGTQATKEVDVLLKDVDKIIYKGEQRTIHRLTIKRLLPDTRGYITYEGSLSQPGCFETVTWILLNKPIYITQKLIDVLRTLNAESKNSASEVMVQNNFRPVTPLNHRPVRTNINFPQNKHRACSMQTDLKYKLNMLFVRQLP